MYKIERIHRTEPNSHWETVEEFPDWNLSPESEAAALYCFLLMFNRDGLDSNYYYRVAWS